MLPLVSCEGVCFHLANNLTRGHTDCFARRQRLPEADYPPQRRLDMSLNLSDASQALTLTDIPPSAHLAHHNHQQLDTNGGAPGGRAMLKLGAPAAAPAPPMKSSPSRPVPLQRNHTTGRADTEAKTAMAAPGVPTSSSSLGGYLSDPGGGKGAAVVAEEAAVPPAGEGLAMQLPSGPLQLSPSPQLQDLPPGSVRNLAPSFSRTFCVVSYEVSKL
jgi:hypothetical protein